MVGYNINHFDKYILQGILCGFDPYDITQFIIVQDRNGWQYSKQLNKFPVITYDVLIKDKSLKQLEASLGLEIVETSVPFDIDRKLTDEEIQETIKYCKHDVACTFEIFLQDGFQMSPQDSYSSSVGIIKEFKFPIEYMAKTKSQLGCAVLGASKRQLDDEFDIISPTTLKLGKYEYVREWFLNPENHWYDKHVEGRKSAIKNELVTEIAGLEHTFAWGGVHASVERTIEDGLLLMCDFGSLYPNIMVEYDLISRGVPNPEKYKSLLKTRMHLKSIGDSRESSYKIALNGSYGQMGYEFSPLYDKKMANNVCVHGQLIALDLIEKLEKIGMVKNSNTDGVLVKVENENDRLLVIEACKEVSDRVRIPIDVEEYTRFIVKDVNNYIAIKPNGKIKAKGSYVKTLNPLEYNMNIISKSIREYYINNVPIEKTINECNDLIEFQIISKAGSKYQYVLHGDKKIDTKVNRVFASKLQSDGGMTKVHKLRGFSKIEMTPLNCFIDNGDIRGKKVPSNLDKNWYIELATRRCAEFIDQRRTKKKA